MSLTLLTQAQPWLSWSLAMRVEYRDLGLVGGPYLQPRSAENNGHHVQFLTPSLP